jgi:hypothetical protein
MGTKHLCAILVGLLLCAAPSLVHARDGMTHPLTGQPLVAEALRAGVSVNIDANLDEWGGVEPAVIDCMEQINVGPGSWSSPADGSVNVYCMWDDSNIYIAAVATDDVAMFTKTEGSIWQQDCIEVFFEPENLGIAPPSWPHSSHYQFGLAPGGPDDAPQKYNWCNCDGNDNVVPDYIDIASVVSSPYSGYIVEASIGLDALPIMAAKVSAGNTVGYHLSMDDNDGQGSEPDAHITWSGGGPHDDSFFGNLTFSSQTATAVSPQSKAATTWGLLKKAY